MRYFKSLTQVRVVGAVKRVIVPAFAAAVAQTVVARTVAPVHDDHT